ncbi:universal stress protein [Streptomyces sp. NPDC007063]|uniref:universal stress protein n=1 Tax=Streptomyces sp. NPDC007063 TaxID=3364772 RepID=UPI0036750732
MAHLVTAGTDGTPESTAAVRWAAREATARGAPLQLVHVQVADSALDQLVAPDESDEPRRHTEEVLHEATAGLSDDFPDLAVSTKSATGEPARLLTELSETSDLLVIGSRGLSTLGGYLVGSVALPAVAHAQCPVVLVRARAGSPQADEAPAGGAAHGAPRPVVAGVDLSHPCDELLDFAFGTAGRRAAQLEIRHGWEPPAYYGARTLPRATMALDELLAERAAAVTAKVRPWCEKHPDVEVDVRAFLEQPAALLVKAAESGSLLVVGRRQRTSRFGPHVGSVVHAVMHHSRTPVAVVPHT